MECPLPSPKPKLISGKKKEIAELVEIYTYGSLHGTGDILIFNEGLCLSIKEEDN